MTVNGTDDPDADVARIRDLMGWLAVNTARGDIRPTLSKRSIWAQTRRATRIDPDGWDDACAKILTSWG